MSQTATAEAISHRLKDDRDGDWHALGHGVEIWRPAWSSKAQALLTPEIVALVSQLHRQLEATRQHLLEARRARQLRWNDGALPSPPEHRQAAAPDWRVAALPQDLMRRRVEITGPVNNRRMVIGMLNRNAAGVRADTAMLDFEDSMKPSWRNVLDGVENVIGVATGELSAVKAGTEGAPDEIKRLDPRDMALPMVRVRGLHLDESNLRVDGSLVAAGLLDFAICFGSTAELLLRRGTTPTYYVPKVEHHAEARWWNDLFRQAQQCLGMAVGSLRATFLIETLPAALDIEGILFEIRQHAAGLNVGRWDKIFSDIKVLMRHRDRIMADRSTIGMNRPWMRAYAETLIDVCHRRGAMAIGGMAAFTPGRDAASRARQTAKVLADKRFEFDLGHDGCWVSHPYFIDAALEAFPRDRQLDVRPSQVPRPATLLPAGGGPYSESGLRTNLRVAIAYLEGWNRDIGCIAWDDLMEDLATLEISRAQTWQWLHHRIALDDGTVVSRQRVEEVLDQELERIETAVKAQAPCGEAAASSIDSFRRARADAGSLFADAEEPSAEFAPFLSRASEPVPKPAHEGG